MKTVYRERGNLNEKDSKLQVGLANHSKNGAAYENAFKQELLRRGSPVVVSAAGSKGPYNLVLPAVGYQLKTGRFSCAAADRMVEAALDDCRLLRVVHRTKDREFCEH